MWFMNDGYGGGLIIPGWDGVIIFLMGRFF